MKENKQTNTQTNKEEQVICTGCNQFNIELISFIRLENNTRLNLRCSDCGKLITLDTAGSIEDDLNENKKEASYLG